MPSPRKNLITNRRKQTAKIPRYVYCVLHMTAQGFHAQPSCSQMLFSHASHELCITVLRICAVTSASETFSMGPRCNTSISPALVGEHRAHATAGCSEAAPSNPAKVNHVAADTNNRHDCALLAIPTAHCSKHQACTPAARLSSILSPGTCVEHKQNVLATQARVVC